MPSSPKIKKEDILQTALEIVQDTKENMYCMLHNTGMTYLKALGVREDVL